MQSSGFVSLARYIYYPVFRNFHLTTSVWKTHYEVLKVAQNCSNKDIKEAFIKLSKKFHPDINKNSSDTHNEFVRLNEAYSVLSRPDKRREYDLSLQTLHPPPPGAGPDVYEYDFQKDPWKDPSFFRNRDRSKDDENRSKPYYGIGKLGRLSNSWLVAFLFAITAVGVALQALAIRHSMTLRRDALDEASARHSELHSAMQERAHGAGNRNTLRMMHSRLGGTSAELSPLLKDDQQVEEQNQQQQQQHQHEQPPAAVKVIESLPAVGAEVVSIS